MAEEAAADYRPVSPLAVAALAAGACSALALVSPICWVLPIIAIVLSCAALLDVHREGARKAGGAAALVGLALATGFGAQALADAAVGRWLVERRAAAAASLWLEAVRAGRLADAAGMTGPAAPGAGGALAEAFAAQPVVRAVRGCGGEAAAEVTGVAAGEGEESGWVVRVRVRPCAGEPDGTVALRLLLEPTAVPRQGGSLERWTVRDFAIDD